MLNLKTDIMNILNYTDAENYLQNKQVYFRKRIESMDLGLIAEANMVHIVGKVEINDIGTKDFIRKVINIEINGVEASIYQYVTDIELFAWIKTTLIPLNELVDNYLKCSL